MGFTAHPRPAGRLWSNAGGSGGTAGASEGRMVETVPWNLIRLIPA